MTVRRALVSARGAALGQAAGRRGRRPGPRSVRGFRILLAHDARAATCDALARAIEGALTNVEIVDASSIDDALLASATGQFDACLVCLDLPPAPARRRASRRARGQQPPGRARHAEPALAAAGQAHPASALDPAGRGHDRDLQRDRGGDQRLRQRLSARARCAGDRSTRLRSGARAPVAARLGALAARLERARSARRAPAPVGPGEDVKTDEDDGRRSGSKTK